MNETATNIAAVTVFTLVMMTLLGPFVHLSPVVPAIAAFGILGVATLDSFGLQGRFGTLVVDWVAGWSGEYRDRIVRHEAGHFLVAHLLDIPVTGYTLSAWEAFRQGLPGYGGVSFDTQPLDAELQQGRLSEQLLERYCTVWMAGIAAEQLAYAVAEGGVDDRQKLRLLWTVLKRSNQEAEQREKWSIFQAKTLLQTHESAYEALVIAMKARSSLAECQGAISTHLQASDQ